MDGATQTPVKSRLDTPLAGLQAGMLGACWMLLWLGVSAEWQRRSFWTAENLMASAFYGERSIFSGFAGRTLSGAALYLLLYSALGAVFAWAAGRRLRPLRVFLLGITFALCWYYLSFRFLWKSVFPLIALLHSATPTALGHLIYGGALGRYPKYLPQPPKPVEPEAAVAQEITSATALTEPPGGGQGSQELKADS